MKSVEVETPMGQVRDGATADSIINECCGQCMSVADYELLASRIISALTAARAEGEWRDIESAPTDGTEVILMVERRAGIRWGTLVGHYMPGGHCIEDHPAIDEGWYFWSGRMFDRASKPTHWMPLPAPPKGDVSNGK